RVRIGSDITVFHDRGHRAPTIGSLPMYHCGARVPEHASLAHRARDGLAAPEEGSRPTAVIAIVHRHPGDYLDTPPDATHAAASDGRCVFFVTLPKPVVMLKSA